MRRRKRNSQVGNEARPAKAPGELPVVCCLPFVEDEVSRGVF